MNLPLRSVPSLKLAALILCCAVAFPLTAQAPFGVPLSNNVISVDVMIDKVHQASLEVREGALGAITVGTGETLAFAPALTEDKDGVDFLVLEIRDSTVDQIDLVSLGMSESRTISHKGHEITFRPQSVTRHNFSTTAPDRALDYRPAELRKSFGREGGGECCVTCGTLSVCGTRAALPCGSCEAPI